MSDFDDEEGVDEPVLEDDEEDDDPDEEVSRKSVLHDIVHSCSNRNLSNVCIWRPAIVGIFGSDASLYTLLSLVFLIQGG